MSEGRSYSYNCVKGYSYFIQPLPPRSPIQTVQRSGACDQLGKAMKGKATFLKWASKTSSPMLLASELLGELDRKAHSQDPISQSLSGEKQTCWEGGGNELYLRQKRRGQGSLEVKTV